MGVLKHPRSSQNSKSLQYLKKELRHENGLLYEAKHQSFLPVDFDVSYKLLLS